MKTVKCIVLALLAVLPMSSIAYAVDLSKYKHPVKPFLWKVEGKGMGDGVYLFGTVHFSDSWVTTLHPAAEVVFQKAQRVYTESNLTDRGAREMRVFLVRKKTKTLADAIGSDLAAAVDAEIKHLAPGRSLGEMGNLKTWALRSALAQLVNGGDGKPPLDRVLSDRAYERRATVIALETPQEQLGTLDSLSEAEQLALLKAYVIKLRKAREAESAPEGALFLAYLKGDEREMLIAAGRAPGSKRRLTAFEKKLKKGMLEDRNKRMAAKIEIEALKHPNKTHFFAVGVSHYIGEKSIAEILRKKGYAVTRVGK